MSKTRAEQLRERIANRLMEADGWSLKVSQADISLKRHYLERADVAIQAFKDAGGVFVDKEAGLPDSPYQRRYDELKDARLYDTDYYHELQDLHLRVLAYNEAQQDILKAGWVKEVGDAL